MLKKKLKYLYLSWLSTGSTSASLFPGGDSKVTLQQKNISLDILGVQQISGIVYFKIP
jgi:hypothetical protein